MNDSDLVHAVRTFQTRNFKGDCFQSQLNNWRQSASSNVWLETDVVSMYVRKGVHFILGETYRTIDIGNVTTYSKYQHKGVFKQVLALIEKQASTVYVENIQNPILYQALMRYGYVVVDNNAGDTFDDSFFDNCGLILPCMYKHLK
jgi:hypothetical protein